MKKLFQLKTLYLMLLVSSVGWGQYSGIGVFQKITSNTELTDGYYVITNVDEEFAMNNQHDGSLFPETGITLVSNELINPSVELVWKIETNGTGKTIYSDDGDIYASYTGNDNEIQAVSSVTSDNQRWTFTYSTDEFIVTNLAVPNRTLRYNSGSPRFVCYGTTFGQNLQLFKLDESSTSSPILDADSFSLSNLDYVLGDGPSTEQSNSVSGSNLDGSDVTVSLPTSSDFEIAETASGSYSNSITLPSFDGTATTIFVQLKSGLNLGSYTDQITISGGDASSITVDLEGEVLEDIFLIYDFIGETVTPNQSPDNATTSPFNLSSGNVGFGTTGTWAGSGTPYAEGSSGWGQTNSDDAKNFSFTVDADPGFVVDATNLSFEWRTTGAGPSAITVEINGTEVTSFDSGSNAQDVLDIELLKFENLNNLNVVIKGWDNGSRSTSGGGSFRINDVRIDGEVKPIAADFYYQNDAWTPSDPAGVSSATDNILIADGSVDITSTLEANNLDISLSSTLNITPSGILNLAGDINNNGDLVFQSDASGTGQLAEFSGSITGDVSVERYIPAKRSFRLVSSAVGGATIADSWQQNTHITGLDGVTNGFDATTSNNPSMFSFDNTIADQSNGAAWQAITNTSTMITAGTPYRLMVRGDRTIDLSNDPVDDATETALSATGTMLTGSFSPTLATAAHHYSFVGNPYQAVVDFNAVTKTNLTGYLYIWDASIAGANGNGGFTVVDASDGSEVTSISPYSSDANRYIMPGQAFFVQNTAAGNANITFEEADKLTAQAQVGIFSKITNFYINSRLYKTSALQNGETESDAIGLRFNENYTTIGSDEDASKLANPGENYAIVNNGLKSIDKQKVPTDGHQIDLLIVNYEESAYSLTFNLDNQPETLKVYLNDSYLTTQTELTDSTIYDFTVDANVPESIDQNRFYLSFEEVTLSTQNSNKAQARLYPNPLADTLQIELPSSIELKAVQLFNLLGEEVLASSRAQLDVSRLASGVYLVVLETSAGKETKKIIKK